MHADKNEDYLATSFSLSLCVGGFGKSSSAGHRGKCLCYWVSCSCEDAPVFMAALQWSEVGDYPSSICLSLMTLAKKQEETFISIAVVGIVADNVVMCKWIVVLLFDKTIRGTRGLWWF